MDDALDKLARRDELRRRASGENPGTPPAVTELVEAIAGVISRHPELGVTVGVEGAGDPVLLHFGFADGVVQVSADNTVAARVAEVPTPHADFEIDVDPEPVYAEPAYAEPVYAEPPRATHDDQDRFGPTDFDYEEPPTAERPFVVPHPFAATPPPPVPPQTPISPYEGSQAFPEPPYSAPPFTTAEQAFVPHQPSPTQQVPQTSGQPLHTHAEPQVTHTQAAHTQPTSAPPHAQTVSVPHQAQAASVPHHAQAATVPHQATPQSAAPPGTAPQGTAPQAAAPQSAPPFQAVPHQAAPHQAMPHQAVSQPAVSQPAAEPGFPPPLAQPIPLQVERPEETEQAARRLAALLRDDPTLLDAPHD
ncbi:hypothetical protein [Actinoplanes sp. OR16]|uniref:hypothetical protein n=1 Tax=Actinoplanes sp. OR16 TaxID=946334 RepID=UPI000FDC3CF2|nr:hypothetical protein [Actinoplanes sp. OR16]